MSIARLAHRIECREAFLAAHSDTADEILANEMNRRERNATKAAKRNASNGPLFDEESGDEGNDDE